MDDYFKKLSEMNVQQQNQYQIKRQHYCDNNNINSSSCVYTASILLLLIGNFVVV